MLATIARVNSLADTLPGSNSTVAVLVARFTCARLTPAVWARVRSMVRAQAAHVMPETGRSTRSGVASFMAVCLCGHFVPELPHGVGNYLRFHQVDVVFHCCLGLWQINGYLGH